MSLLHSPPYQGGAGGGSSHMFKGETSDEWQKSTTEVSKRLSAASCGETCPALRCCCGHGFAEVNWRVVSSGDSTPWDVMSSISMHRPFDWRLNWTVIRTTATALRSETRNVSGTSKVLGSRSFASTTWICLSILTWFWIRLWSEFGACARTPLWSPLVQGGTLVERRALQF